MFRLLVKQGEVYEKVVDGIVWHKDGQPWGYAVIQEKRSRMQGTQIKLEWEDIEVVFDGEESD